MEFRRFGRIIWSWYRRISPSSLGHSLTWKIGRGESWRLFYICTHLGMFWSWLYLNIDKWGMQEFMNSKREHFWQIFLETTSAALHQAWSKQGFSSSQGINPFVPGTNGPLCQRWTQNYLLWPLTWWKTTRNADPTSWGSWICSRWNMG